MHYGQCSYYSLGRVYPRDKLRQPFPPKLFQDIAFMIPLSRRPGGRESVGWPWWKDQSVKITSGPTNYKDWSRINGRRLA